MRRTTSLAAVVAVVAGFVAVTGTGGAVAADVGFPLRTGGVQGIDFAGGTLSTVERAANGDPYVMARRVSADGSTASARVPLAYAGTYANGAHVKYVPCDAGSCVPIVGSGNGEVGYVFVQDGRESVQIRLGPDELNGTEPAVTGARIVDFTGRFFVYDAQSTGKQYIDDVQPYRATDVRMTRSRTAASVWGSQLWTTTSTTGAVAVTDIETKKAVETVSTGSACAIKELQAVGRWIYWNCGPTGRAGVYDRTAKKSFAVPSGPAMVGDGYLVRHDRTAGKLVLTDFHTGQSAAPRPVAELPAGDTADQRRLTWAVDKFGGDLAYVGTDNALRVVPSGVPSQSLAKIESEVDDAASLDVKTSAWSSTWQFSKPVTWTFTAKDARGRTVRTLTGKGGPEADVSWDGRTDAGAYPSNGPHTWTLSAKAAEGAGTYTAGGKLGVSGGLPGHHDQGGNGYGELVTLNSLGDLTLHYTEGKGVFDWKRSGSGWPAGSVAVPFGDMGSDRCAEMLVRMPGGELRRYAGTCGGTYKPAGSHTSLGTGWNAYNVLTAPGDLTGDGRTDLLARKASTSDLYLFADLGNGKLAAGKKIRSGWTGYTHVVGAGDLNGDGIGDVLARGKNGTLYRYDGTGKGTLRERVTVFTAWGASYNTIVGVGDITGDGRNDLVIRDKGGNLYRNDGKGNGSFTSRTRIATGWQGYKGVF
ncbi:FG-GAP-like repeat-containing protein [Streptomyces sp. NPDC102264]|uniref:FG-GAP-like repeat-containing protein n=1 Tax=Streptomyces sp. NPDC102264 TaxID=3366149 RepID=UPI0038027C2E